jgi:hypothetical protein
MQNLDSYHTRSEIQSLYLQKPRDPNNLEDADVITKSYIKQSIETRFISRTINLAIDAAINFTRIGPLGVIITILRGIADAVMDNDAVNLVQSRIIATEISTSIARNIAYNAIQSLTFMKSTDPGTLNNLDLQNKKIINCAEGTEENDVVTIKNLTAYYKKGGNIDLGQNKIINCFMGVNPNDVCTMANLSFYHTKPEIKEALDDFRLTLLSNARTEALASRVSDLNLGNNKIINCKFGTGEMILRL